jgi:predicted NBD/HSP70 family sugar kinase
MTSIELRAEYESLYLHHYVDEDAYINFEDWLLLYIQQKLLPKLSIELSDEEIEKASYKFWEFKEHTASSAWKMGAKWYREQLKEK